MRKNLRAEPRIKLHRSVGENGKLTASVFQRTGPSALGHGSQIPYKAASIYGRGADLPSSNPGPNTSILGVGSILRARARDLYRQNGKASGAVDSLIAELVGPGYTVIPNTGDPVLDAEMSAMIQEWEAACDLDGMTNWDGIVTGVETSAFVAGDAFVQLVRMRPDGSGIAPLRVRAIESEFCPYDQTEILPNGDRVVMGVILDKLNRRKGFRMFKEHPEDWTGIAGMHGHETIDLTTEQILHRIWWNGRLGQHRGESGLARAIIYLYGVDSHLDSELQRKNDISKITAIVTRAAAEAQTSLDEMFQDQHPDADIEVYEEDGAADLQITPGTIMSFEPGEQIQTIAHPDLTGTWEPFMKTLDRNIAKSIGVMYEHVSEDWDGGNDRTKRISRNHFERKVMNIQYTRSIPQLIRPAHRALVDAAVLGGTIRPPRGMSDERLKSAMYIPSEWAYIHPVQEESAREKRIQMGISSPEREAAGRGDRISDIDAENARRREQERSDSEQRDPENASVRGAIFDNGQAAFDPEASRMAMQWRRKYAAT